MKQFDTIRAKLNPRRMDDLTPEALACVGIEGEWKTLWLIETGPYADEWAMELLGAVGLGWIPSGDLEVGE